MRVRDILQFEITPRRRAPPAERSGAELVRENLEHRRWWAWIAASLCFSFCAAWIPLACEVTVMLLSTFPRFADLNSVLLLLLSLMLIWGQPAFLVVVILLPRPTLDRIFQRRRRPTPFPPPPFRGWRLYPTIGFASGLLVLFIVLALLTPGPFLRAVQELMVLAEISLLLCAGTLVARGLFLELGDEVRCARCAYPVPPGSLPEPGVCPECGSDLTRNNGMKIGQRKFRPCSLACGLSIVVAMTVIRLV